MLRYTILSFTVSLILCTAAVVFFRNFASVAEDLPSSGPQKFHRLPTPRLGGMGVWGAWVAVLSVSLLYGHTYAKDMFLLFSVSLPVFISGLVEDLTGRVGWKIRTLFMSVAALLAVFLVDARVVRVDVPYFDEFFKIWLFSLLFTLFALVGITNAINIIDGFNGLASMVSVLIFLAFGYVAYKVEDWFILMVCAIMIGALLGFFLLNYPNGLIFLGDGGAYFVGFYMGLAGVLLVKRNPEVSAWLPVVVCIYPIFEVLFSIYRKWVLRGISPFLPDGLHLHMLFYKRFTKILLGPDADKLKRNTATSPFLWLLTSFGVLPGMLWWNNTKLLMVSVLTFSLIYVLLYWKVLMRKPPSWAR